MNKYMSTICTLMVLSGCKKPYTPQTVSAPNNYLVVEGVIDTGPDSTFVKLSRTVDVSTKKSFKPELFAEVDVESDANVSYPLPEKGNGTYASAPLNLDNGHKYRLYIKTADSRTYLSDFVEAKTTPDIDSLGYKIQSNGVQVYVSAHDAASKTRYYRWDYDETWLFHTTYISLYKLVDNLPVYRPPAEQIYQCWGSDTATNITLASTTRLSTDLVTQQPIAFIPSSAEKLGERYSIVVRQYALTQAGYEYYVNLKKNTEQLGDIFDTQPSSIKGNISCTSNPSEPVIGFISAGTISKKRIFVDRRELPAWRTYTYYDERDCLQDTISLKTPDKVRFYYAGPPYGYLPTSLPYLAASIECVDCTLRGTNKQPDFWK